MRRIVPLSIVLLLFCPFLAHADALDGALFMLEILAAVWGIALLCMLFSVLAYLKPNARTLAISSYVVNGLGLLLGLFWALLFSRDNGTLAGIGANPFSTFSVPFAVWLWAANKVACRSTSQASTWLVALGVVSASSFVNAGLFWLMRWLLPSSGLEAFGTIYWQWLAGPALLLGIWWLVLRQVQRFQPLGWLPQAMWLVPAQALLLGTVWSYLPVLSVLSQMVVDLRWFAQLLGHSLLSYGIGVLALWLNQRQHQLAAESPN
jgi:hypothetical protein